LFGQDLGGSSTGGHILSGRGVEKGSVSVEALVGEVLQGSESLAIDVEEVVADEGNLVEDGGVNAQVAGLVTINVATVEDLALSIHIGVESGLFLAAALEVGLRNGSIVRVRLPFGQDLLHFSNVLPELLRLLPYQSRIQK